MTLALRRARSLCESTRRSAGIECAPNGACSVSTGAIVAERAGQLAVVAAIFGGAYLVAREIVR